MPISQHANELPKPTRVYQRVVAVVFLILYCTKSYVFSLRQAATSPHSTPPHVDRRMHGVSSMSFGFVRVFIFYIFYIFYFILFFPFRVMKIVPLFL